MRALVFHRPKGVSVDTVDDPTLQQPTDVILRVTSTAICGSDLHIYNGYFPQPKPMVLGHEFMGVVEDVGAEVKNLRRGDRVVVPFPIACGACFFCQRGLHPHCQNSNPAHYGPEGGLLTQKGGALFGYTDLYGGYQGGQAEYVRVPYADVGPRKVPDGLTDEQVLFLTDIFPTGWSAVDWAGVKPGDTVAVFGCGPVGLMAMKSAAVRGARVVGLDREAYRMQKARDVAGATVINIDDKDHVEQVRALTQGRGADVVIDAVGMEAHHGALDAVANVLHAQVGYIDALKSCFSAVRRGGTVSVVGVYGTTYDNFPLGQAFDKGVRIVMGQATVHRYIDELLRLVAEGHVRLDDVMSHQLPLADAPRAYEIFNEKKDGCVKVVLKP